MSPVNEGEETESKSCVPQALSGEEEKSWSLFPFFFFLEPSRMWLRYRREEEESAGIWEEPGVAARGWQIWLPPYTFLFLFGKREIISILGSAPGSKILQCQRLRWYEQKKKMKKETSRATQYSIHRAAKCSIFGMTYLDTIAQRSVSLNNMLNSALRLISHLPFPSS